MTHSPGEPDPFAALRDDAACARAVALIDKRPAVRALYADLVAARGEVQACLAGLMRAHAALVEAFAAGGKLLLAGNGGSHADALHFSAELLKEFRLPHPLAAGEQDAYRHLSYGEGLAAHLRPALPAVVLGANSALASAVINDSPDPQLVFAQECRALVRPGDVFLGLSTSGNAHNVVLALAVAQVRGARTVALTGRDGGRLGQAADILVAAPAEETAAVQELHIVLYHALAAGVEAHFFTHGGPGPEGSGP